MNDFSLVNNGVAVTISAGRTHVMHIDIMRKSRCVPFQIFYLALLRDILGMYWLNLMAPVSMDLLEFDGIWLRGLSGSIGLKPPEAFR